jgi:uncharacterized protein YfdQ (DUF2303 family)
MSEETKNQQENLLQTAIANLPKPQIYGDCDEKKPFALIWEKRNGSYEIKSLNEFARQPRSAVEKMTCVKSFVEYVKTFRTKEMQIFAKFGQKKITAFFDYLPTPKNNASAKDLQPGNRLHSCEIEIKLSEKYERWKRICKKRIPQMDFAEFLDENFQDVMIPDGLTFKELALSLSAEINQSFESSRRLKDGASRGAWQVDVKIKSGAIEQLEIPERITLGIPIYDGGNAVELQARMRVRIDSGTAYFILMPNDWEEIEKTDFQNTIEKIEKELGLPIFIG